MNRIELTEIKELYAAKDRASLQKCFKLFEKANWTLAEIIAYIRENLAEDKKGYYDIMTVERIITLGPVVFVYEVEEDLAQGMEDEDYFRLHFYINYDYNEKRYKHHYEKKRIGSDALFTCFYLPKDIPNFEKRMDQHFNTHIQLLNLERVNGLFDYLEDYYARFFLNQ